ncbi:MAG: Nif11-like leader peptide family natural product precursor [Deltaproteobacteria bacterium]|nr:MAG: Nif11-like leader peptide family natural product precursor [Deltaproteobacteria bacterium]
MSVQSAKDFLKRIHTDQALRHQLDAAADLSARKQVLKEAGFDFTVAEYQQVVEELAAAAGKELTPEELQGVAGGFGRGGKAGSGCILDTNPCVIHWSSPGGPV